MIIKVYQTERLLHLLNGDGHLVASDTYTYRQAAFGQGLDGHW